MLTTRAHLIFRFICIRGVSRSANFLTLIGKVKYQAKKRRKKKNN